MHLSNFKARAIFGRRYIQGCALGKILGSPLGSQPCRLGWSEVKLGGTKEKKIN